MGKTCLLVRFKDGAFLAGSFISTVGIDFRVSVNQWCEKRKERNHFGTIHTSHRGGFERNVFPSGFKGCMSYPFSDCYVYPVEESSVRSFSITASSALSNSNLGPCSCCQATVSFSFDSIETFRIFVHSNGTSVIQDCQPEDGCANRTVCLLKCPRAVSIS